MIYKAFRAPTYKEAVLSAKMQFGNDFYIIGRKNVKEGGFLGLFAKNITEITVAKNEENINRSDEFPKPKALPKKANNDGEILKELSEIKTKLKNIVDSRYREKEEGAPYLKKLIEVLKANDFSEDYINRLKEKFESELTLKDVSDPESLKDKVKNHINDCIKISGPIDLGKEKPNVVVLLGPTGVGKTTTIAKLAASYGVLQKHKVELFTIDSYRIAAIEQLGKYAELMQIPFTAISSREEFKSAVYNSKAELIFVDTAGRSQKNNLQLAELRSILDGVKSNLDIHLVLSATTKYGDALDIFTRFNQFMYSNVIITKLDETNTIGSILSIMNKDKKLSYFTTGQGVPDDIELASRDKLFDMLVFDNVI